MVPFILVAAAFILWPVLEAVRLAFYSKSPFRPTMTYVGLDNFRYLFGDPVFWAALRQAVVWTLSSTILQSILGVGLALLLHQAIRGINVFRGLLLFPYMVPTVVIALIWRWMFNPEFGIINATLLRFGVIEKNIYWFSEPTWAMASVILLNVWKFTPFVVICVLARLQMIPVDLYDAARVDGASAWQRFRDITLPQLKAVLSVVVVFRTIWTFNKFEEIYLLTRGGPGTSTFNLAVYGFEQATANLKLGVAAATGVVMLALLFTGSALYLRLIGRQEE
ncbi:MAG: sugar ABC transporter permease [Candidatus Rokubacteria bacterium]|nr:sugar ABC transporter permease [Candidatus Rokubacteria bacterium]